MNKTQSFYNSTGRFLAFPTRINASAKKVWQLLVDTDQWPKWGPSVNAVQCSERFIDMGISGRIRIPFGIWLPFIITDFLPNTCWAWRVAGIRATGHRVIARDADHCILLFDVPQIAAPYAYICMAAARRIKSMAEAQD